MNNNNPLVSIIMPAYNSENYIGEAISSVLAQTYPNWELLVINDGSTDNTERLVKGFKDERIRYFSQENGGVSSARNRGLKAMNGDFFCFLDSDDLLPQNSLKSRVDVLIANADIHFVDGQVSIFDGKKDNSVGHYQPSFHGFPKSELMRLSNRCFFSPTWMIRRIPSTNYKFREGMTHGEDLWFFLEISDQGQYTFTSEEILYYRKHNDSAMANLDGLATGYKELYQLVKSHCKPEAKQKRYLRYRVSRIMFLSFLKAGHPLKALNFLFAFTLS